MALSISGYVLEKPRCGAGNSPFTPGPDNLISDPIAFEAAYPASEINPSTEFLVLVTDDGGTGKLPDARFGWTKNEVVQRFDYDGKHMAFKPLPGGPPSEIGVLAVDSNTNRLKIPTLISTDLTGFPVRISVFGPGSGTTFAIVLVTEDADFTPSPGPVQGTVEVSEESWTLNWSEADLTTSAGKSVRFQGQLFYPYNKSTGLLGNIEEVLLLSPLPKAGQIPLLQIGYALPLTVVGVADESSFSSDPGSGVVEWAADTGRLNFSPTDVTANIGKGIYYLGALMETGLSLVPLSLGTVGSPLPLPYVPSSGVDVIFRLSNGSTWIQKTYVKFVDDFDTSGSEQDIQVKNSDGSILFSAVDRSSLGSWSVTAWICDLPIERGLSLRLFRSPVDMAAANSSVKDVASLYSVTGAIYADPIIGSPMVLLPSLPVESLPMKVKILQKNGSYTSDDFPNLRTTTGDGLGYFLDYAQGAFRFGNRVTDAVIERPLPSGAMQLPDCLIQTFDRKLELETTPGAGDWLELDLERDAAFEPNSGTVSFLESFGAMVTSGDDGVLTGSTFSSLKADFSDVCIGDSLFVLSESSPGTVKGVYTIEGVLGSEISLDVDSLTDPGPLTFEVRTKIDVLADRYFEPVVLSDPAMRVERILPLGPIQNSPRYTIAMEWIEKVRFRYGMDRFSTSVSSVTTFSDPNTLSQGSAEIDSATGEVNFAQVDIDAGGTVYWSRRLLVDKDYKLTAELGFFEFSERMLAMEEGLITYVPTATNSIVTERMRFLIRKEIASHDPNNVIAFDPTGRDVADTPVPAVFRGGRPQDSSQVAVDRDAKTIRFLPDDHLDGLLPHGPVIGADETIHIDYYVYNAIGGEKTTTVLQYPIATAVVSILGDTDNFVLRGDWTNTFIANRALRIENSEAHLIQSVSYDGTENQTTISITSGDVFRDDWTKPLLYQASGQTAPSGSYDSYFWPFLTSFDIVPRGSNKIRFTGGDYTKYLQSGTLLRFELNSRVEIAIVQGSAYDATSGKTEVTLSANTVQQYAFGSVLLKKTIRPIFESAPKEANTWLTPVDIKDPSLDPSMRYFYVFSKVKGELGKILLQPADYQIDAVGKAKFSEALLPEQMWGAAYVGYETIEAMRRARVSYVSIVSPMETNGILNQTLICDYSIYSPDTFYFRVVKMSTYSQELAAKYSSEAKASSPGGGPMTSNSSGPSLQTQGSPSPFFPEGQYANEDIVCRASLKFYNDAINYLEDVLQDMDGRSVGGQDGRFVFDGKIDNPKRPIDPTQTFDWSTVTNQIDDRIKILDAPYEISFTFPDFSIAPKGTYVLCYEPSQYSRFYPTFRQRYGVTGSGQKTGDKVLDTGAKNVTSVQNLRTRLAWAQVSSDVVAGSSIVPVDNAQGSKEGARPPFKTGMEIVIQKTDGTFIVDESMKLAVSLVESQKLTLAGGVPSGVPAGSTIYHSPADSSDKVVTYVFGRDYDLDPENGQILYVKPFPPYDGSETPPVPAELLAKPLPPATPLSFELTAPNILTSPEKIPALWGKPTDDDGEMRFPIRSPSLDCELTIFGGGVLPKLADKVGPGGVSAYTTMPFEGQGDLDPTGYTITVTSGSMSPAPGTYDLVRILDGVNGPSNFHRVISATPTTITLETPFVPDSGFNFVAAVTNILGGGIGDFNGTTLVDAFATFVSWGVMAGHTVTIYSGPNAGRRLQVVQVQSQTTLMFEVAVGTPDPLCFYSIGNPLPTFGSLSGIIIPTPVTEDLGKLDAILSTGEPPVRILSETKALEDAIDLSFDYVFSGSSGSFDSGAKILTDTSATFITSGVESGHLLYIRSPVDVAGIYIVSTVTSETTLEIAEAFPVDGTGIAYKIGSVFGMGSKDLSTILDVLKGVDVLSASVSGMYGASALIPVETSSGVDTTAYANGLTAGILSAAETAVTDRITALSDVTGPKATLENLLVTGGLYDKRYTWISARIGLEKGTIVLKARAIQDRLKAQAKAVENMTKMLVLQSS